VTDLHKEKSNLLDFSADSSGLSSVAVLLCTFNGARFLTAQLDSIESQEHSNWFLIASDDGSTDHTLEILRKYQALWPPGRLTIRSGPQKGFCQNFLSLACDPEIRADYYSFCDQDDVWLHTKLSAALKNINQNQVPGEAYLYCGRTTYVDEKLKRIGSSPLFSFPRTFRNALIQSIAGGNSMVFNQKTKEYLEKIGPVNHPSHDWWLYQLVTGVGGIVFYDPTAQILYRQHKNALVGGNSSIFARIERISMIFKGRLRKWSDLNIAALSSVESILNSSNRETLELFKRMRNAPFKDRLRLMEVAGLYRQTWRGTISLILAALLRKI
jgi:glycosyltransferase involved in cell wall biosynthesis